MMRCYKDAIAMKIALQNSLKASNSEVKLKRFAKLPTKDMPLFFSIVVVEESKTFLRHQTSKMMGSRCERDTE